MISSPSTLPQPSHEGDEGQSAGRKTFRPPGPKKTLNRVSDAEQQLVARYVDRDTACDDAQPGRTAEPRVMCEQPGGLICDITTCIGELQINIVIWLVFVQQYRDMKCASLLFNCLS